MCYDVAAVGIQRQVQFAPTPAGFGTMLFFQPLACAVDLQTGAVDEDVDGTIPRDAIAIPLARRARLARTTAQGRMIGNARSRPISFRTEVSKPSVWRSRNPNTNPSVRAVSIARSQ